ncbi:endo alpha-1,4 polygalactosaminidase [Clostridiales bacterium FE2011]|nr:endo alpha-1,4 polygalactosaminidase [Clostridiales bacterium FE2011]QTE75521.1 endo alpha-1,4 polygalactosaminidase [Clostridiales bacterium FE2010]
MKNQGKGTISVFCAIILIVLTCCTRLAGAEQAPTFKYPYGVFLSICENIEQFADYEIVVIDAQYYPKEELDVFRSKGHKVFSYINIGSLEDFRDYYDEYKDLSLGAYEHWEEEVWVDVSQKRWQDFMLNDIAAGLLEKDIDGFFVDNCDVYYVHPKQEILEGLTVIMKGLKATGKKVIINSGDTFLDAYCEQGGKWDDVISGINQESVFSTILWDEGTFGTAEPEDHEYFVSYIDRYGSQGAEIYLLEYTIDEELVKEIKAFCEERGYTYYVADSIELDG